MKIKKPSLSDILIIFGAILISVSVILLGAQVFLEGVNADRALSVFDALRGLIPTPYDASPDDRANTVMPAMEWEGENYCGLLEIPAYSARLPIGQVWDTSKVSKYPCRYSGSIYDGTLMIGGSDASGQLDLLGQIGAGDSVFVTDLTGARFALAVADAFRTKDISPSALLGLDADLILFARNSLSFDYTVVCCKFGK